MSSSQPNSPDTTRRPASRPPTRQTSRTLPRKLRLPTPLPPELRTREITDIRLMRWIVNFIGCWDGCSRACRRKRGCASLTVKCFDPNIAMIQEVLTDMANWRRLEGPRDPEELEEVATELFD